MHVQQRYMIHQIYLNQKKHLQLLIAVLITIKFWWNLGLLKKIREKNRKRKEDKKNLMTNLNANIGIFNNILSAQYKTIV